MRGPRLGVLALLIAVSSGPSLALEASDTMASWSSATPDAKAELVTKLLKRDGRESGTANVVKCLDAASGVPGHEGLPISKLVQVCAASGSEPV